LVKKRIYFRSNNGRYEKNIILILICTDKLTFTNAIYFYNVASAIVYFYFH